MTQSSQPHLPIQVSSALEVIRATICDSIVGVYLYGSATQGGLRPQSDLDLLVVVDAPLQDVARRRLIEGFLQVSGVWPPRGSERPLEVTVVNLDDVVPWRYPPRKEFVYGEWLRHVYELGAASAPTEDPDLAILLRMARDNSVTLTGSDARGVLDPIPDEDVRRAMIECVPGLLRELPGDARNVLLTLARIWAGLETNQMMTKDRAAAWAAAHLPAEHQAILERARGAYLGLSSDVDGYPERAVQALTAHMEGAIRSYTP